MNVSEKFEFADATAHVCVRGRENERVGSEVSTVDWSTELFDVRNWQQLTAYSVGQQLNATF